MSYDAHHLFKNLKIKAGKIALYTLPLMVGVFFVWYSLSMLSEEEKVAIKNSFKTASYFWISGSLFLGFVSNLSRAYRFKFLLEPLGFKPNYLNSTMAVFATYLVNMIVPRSGEVLRAGLHKKYDDIPLNKVLGVIVAERISDVLMLVVFIAIALSLQASMIEGILFKNSTPTSISLKIALLIAAPLLIFKLYRYFEKSTNTTIKKIILFIQGLGTGVMSIFRMKKKWPFLIHTLFIWALYFLMFYIGTFALKEIQGLTAGAVVVGFVVGALSMTVTNGGLGVYPVLVALALTNFGQEKTVALALGWLLWTCQTLLVIVGGCLSMVLMPIYNDWLSKKK